MIDTTTFTTTTTERAQAIATAIESRRRFAPPRRQPAKRRADRVCSYRGESCETTPRPGQAYCRACRAEYARTKERPAAKRAVELNRDQLAAAFRELGELRRENAALRAILRDRVDLTRALPAALAKLDAA